MATEIFMTPATFGDSPEPLVPGAAPQSTRFAAAFALVTSLFFLWAIAQALLLPNWIAGPAGLAGFGTLFAFRVGREERMMEATFGEAYRAYAARTRRVVPGVF